MHLGDERGYTLLELLVAIAIMAMASVPLAQSLSTGIRAWTQFHDVAAYQEKTLLVRERLAEWIRNAYIANPVRASDIPQQPFVGEPDNIRFIAPVAPDSRSDVLLRVHLYLTEEGQLTADVRQDQPQDIGADEQMTSIVLLEAINDVQFDYFLKQGGTGNWQNSWIADSLPPQSLYAAPFAVKVRLISDHPGFRWPDLIVPVHTAGWSHCAFDSDSAKCLPVQETG